MTGSDLLPSWNDSAARTAILEFVETVTRPGPSYVPPADRIATFDNDGTLWCEKPQYVEAEFVFRRWQEMIEEDPAKANEQPYMALAEDDQTWLSSLLAHLPDLVKGVTEAYEGITVGAFERAVLEFFATATHPTLGVPYTQVGYQPMRELIDLLRAREFLVFICTGGGRDFMRPVSEQLYGIPRERVIGSATAVQYRDGDLYRTSNVEQPIDDGTGKPEHIWMRTGHTPLFAGGNADGDVPMLTTARFSLLIHHDDASREFAYDAGADKALASARDHGWTVVSMQNDFRAIFDR